MIRAGLLLAGLLALCVMLPAIAAIDPLPFESPAQEERFRKLAGELRCVMCQNQSLADSNAGIAGDLRREIFELMQAGRSDDEIKQFLSERYTDFVLYRPPLRANTLLLWFGPLLVLIGGGIAVFVIMRRRAVQYREYQSRAKPLDPEEL
jgi:cytochrome c-type biogenesis protein CcmH